MGSIVGTVALGWGWLTAPLFASLIGAVAALAAVIGTSVALVSLYRSRRGLEVRTVAVSPHDPKNQPHSMKIRLTLRGATAIHPDNFSEKKDFPIDVGARIVSVQDIRVDPTALKYSDLWLPVSEF